MGCCFSDQNSESNQDDIDESTRLLPDVAGDFEASGVQHSYNSTAPSVQPKPDESSALNKILTVTASNVIDVGQLESQTMEQHEYMDRARQYSLRLAEVCAASQTLEARCNTSVSASLGNNTPQNPAQVLAAPTVSLLDTQLITNAAAHASRLVKEIKVKHKEDLVVPFGVP